MAGFATVTTERAERKLNKALRLIEEDGNATVKDLAEIGKRFAQLIAPRDTGRVASFIRIINLRGKEGIKSRIQAQNPTRNPPASYRRGGGAYPNGKFNLTRWMHTSPRAVAHIKSGDPKFMFTTRDMLNGMKKNVATGRFKNINLS